MLHRSREPWKIGSVLFWVLFFVFFPRVVLAYPDAEVVWSAGGGPPFDVGITATVSRMLLSSDEQMIVSSGETVKLIDLGTFSLESVQPIQPSDADKTDGVIGGIVYLSQSNKLIASQEDGDILVYLLNDLTQTPTSYTITAGDKLGPIVADIDSRYAYVADNTQRTIDVINLGTNKLETAIPIVIAGATTFTFTDAVYNNVTGEAYFSTDQGALFVVPAAGTTATLIDIGTTVTPTKLNLVAVDLSPTRDQIFVVDATTPSLVSVSTRTHAKVRTILIGPNSDPTDIVVTSVLNPSGTYAYIPGSKGMTVVDVVSGKVFDYGTDPDVDQEPMPMSAEPLMVLASSADDGNVYALLATSKLGVISERPMVAITSVTYSSGGSKMGVGESVTLTFESNSTGTYELRSQGTVLADGTVLTDNTGAVSGSITADTPVSVTINYDDNTAAFDEGANEVWAFVTDTIGRGRRATSVTVDTPPPDVVIRSTGFGNGRVYVNFDRITVSDMATYRIYVDTDASAVLTKTDVAATVSQPSSGSQLTGKIEGLSNGTEYYVAMDAVDAGGNVSFNRTASLPDGTRVSEAPEATVGPAGLSGEKGCRLQPETRGTSSRLGFGILLTILMLLLPRLLTRKTMLVTMLFLTGLLLPAWAQAQIPGGSTVTESVAPPVSPSDLVTHREPMWFLEVKTGFWMPQSEALKQFFSPCCNLVTRIQGGLLLHHRYGVELGAGFLYKSGTARGEESGQSSEDHFTLMLFPVELNFAWRADYFKWRYVVPYVKAGFDSWVYRESDPGSTITGVKFGCHGVAGLQLNITEMAGSSSFGDAGFDEFFVTLETQYQWINNFGKGGLNLTGPIFSLGVMTTF